MTPQISVQLYSLRNEASKDYESTIRTIAEIGFPCVEPAGYPGYTPEKAASLFKELGIQAPTVHIGLPVGEVKNEIIEHALMMGHKYLITGCPPGFRENYTSMDRVKAMTELYCEAAANAAKHDLQIGYHNHDWDLVMVDGERGYQYFLKNTPESVVYEADMFWVTKAGLDPVAFINEIGPRGVALHFKDGIISEKDTFREAKTESGNVMVSNAVPFRPAGQGQVDLIGASKVAKHAKYIVVELDSFDGDMVQAVRESYQYLTSNKIAVGKR
jgi:sugar phosphate isomerase/epimerase